MAASVTILHADLDAFYVSMELLRHPELRGFPVIVGGAGGRGVVATCSYEARQFGVHSAMPGSRAKQLCPSAVFLPPDFNYYAPASCAFHAILHDFTPTVESAGVDEAYLDVAGSETLFGDPAEIARAIRRRVRDEIGIAVSIGVAGNRLVAKVASDAAKPDGLLVVSRGEEADFFAPRPLRELPMIGPQTAAALQTLGLRTIGDLAAWPVAALEARFGPHGIELHRRALGQSDAPVFAGRTRQKSISRETTFETDEPSPAALQGTIAAIASRLAASLASDGLAARTVTLKLRFPPFETLLRSETPGTLLVLSRDIQQAARAIFDDVWRGAGYRPVRLIGVGLTNIVEKAYQLRLGEDDRAFRLASTVTGIRERFGDDAVRHGVELQQHRPFHR